MIHSVRRADWPVLLLVIAVAAVVRFNNLGVSEYHYDHATLSRLAQQMIETRTLATLGMTTSVGLPNAPASVYVVALPYLFTDDLLLVNAFLVALNVGGVALLWLLAHRYFGSSVGLAAGMIYALNPWAAFYSRGIWAQNFLTPFILLAFLLGLLGFFEGKRWAQAACLPVLLFGAQIHYAAWTLLPVYLWLLWLGRRQLSWRALAVSAALGALVVAPFAVGIIQWAAGREGAQTLGVVFGSRPVDIHRQTLLFPLWLATGLSMERVVAPQSDLLAQLPPPSALWALVGLLALPGLAQVARRQPRLLPLVVLWLGLPVLAFLPTFAPVYTHYFIALIPALALLSGIGLAWLAEQYGLVSRLAAAGVAAAILFSQGVWWNNLLQYINSTATPPGWPSSDGFSVPMGYLLDIRSRLSPVQDVLLLNSLPLKSDLTIWSPLLYHRVSCLREVVSAEGGIAVFPHHPFAVLTAPGGNPYPLPALYANPAQTVLPLRPGEGEYTLAVFDRAPAWPGPALVSIPPARFDNDVRLMGYALEPERLYLDWELPARPAQDEQYFYFAHFLNATGNRIAQRDSNFWPSKYWCEGDRAVLWVDTAVPLTQTAALRVGLYRVVNGLFVNSSVLDDSGNSLGLWVDVPLKAVMSDEQKVMGP
ncbi:MAG: hypothetical protein HZC41_10045 [Chloroflexi bacterium]|nr:hypothetical protein [Chloroflexota bacterium]